MAADGEQASQAETRSPEEIQAEIETTREELGDTVEAIAEKTDVKKQAKRKVAETKVKAAAKTGEIRDTVTSKAEAASGKAKEATPESARAGAQQATQQAAQVAQENPLPTAAVAGFAAGVLVGWVLGRR
jgi:ElaB/YqjD/DUF883 family membrane-anchored ribosome-binding protein